MTDRAVVVIRFLICAAEERRANEANTWPRCSSPRLSEGVDGSVRWMKRTPPRNDVLMFVVGKFDRELALVFRLRGLIRAVRFSECKARIFARPGAQVTDGAD